MPLDDRDYMRSPSPSLGDRIRAVTAFQWLFGLNIAVFVLQWGLKLFWVRDALTGEALYPMGGVSVDALTRGELWTPFTYMFVHGSLGHIILNMFMFWFAGKRVQQLYGQQNLLIIYVLSGLVGAALEMAICAYVLDTTAVSLIGASASVMGLLLAYAVAMPEEELTLLLFFIIPVRMRLWTLAKAVLIMNSVMGGMALFHVLPGWLSGGGGAVAYFAHIGGAVAGWYYARSLGYGGIPMHLFTQDSQRNPFRLRRQPQMAKRVRPVVEVDVEAARRQNPRNDPKVDIMRDEIDPILDKISEQGLHSLTDDERRILEQASRRMGQ